MYAILKQWLLKQMSLFPQHLKASVCSCGFGFCHFCLVYIWDAHCEQLEWTWQPRRRDLLGPALHHVHLSSPLATVSLPSIAPYVHAQTSGSVLSSGCSVYPHQSSRGSFSLSSWMLCDLIEYVGLWWFYYKALLPDIHLKLSFVSCRYSTYFIDTAWARWMRREASDKVDVNILKLWRWDFEPLPLYCVQGWIGKERVLATRTRLVCRTLVWLTGGQLLVLFLWASYLTSLSLHL